jgi:hypothetical protein
MCARFEMNRTRFQPSNTVAFWRALALAQQLVWAGFARREWLHSPPKDGAMVDIPADRFAERSRRTAQLVWDDVPSGQVIRGLVLPNKGNPILRIVTRSCSPEEEEHFGHDRICVIEPPLFSAGPIPIEAPKPPAQGELF